QSAADRTKMLRQYGWQERNRSEFAGVNSRLDELQAAVLRVRLKGLAAANDRRRALASIYQQGLLGLPLQLPGRRLHHQLHFERKRRTKTIVSQNCTSYCEIFLIAPAVGGQK
ncbi:MAG: DegT/DnrJ/EryC1/StrS family aminotransferase, partial [Planctomyces sp.]